jgi:exonuclease SbcC
MIPQRIALEGFLCYGERQEIDLSDLPLGMMSGPNGSGKSSVFDAATFALFCAHRGGEQGHADLIHAGRDAAAVEFEFRLGGALWKVRRALRRRGRGKSPGHQVQLCRWSEPPGEWRVMPEADSLSGFKDWVKRHIGLTFKTFTCSTLLRQGDADRLLAEDPAERFKVLAGVVGMERYQRLEARANDHCKAARVEAGTFEGRPRRRRRGVAAGRGRSGRRRHRGRRGRPGR